MRSHHASAEIIRLVPSVRGRPAAANASTLQIWVERLRGSVGALLNAIHAPGFVRATEILDEVNGQRISIQVGQRFARITVGGRDYYFDRLTGRFDGTGTALD